MSMAELRVEIVRFVQEHQPGIVECVFSDASGAKHMIVDKAPIFSEKDLWSSSVYPQPGTVRCEVLE